MASDRHSFKQEVLEQHPTAKLRTTFRGHGTQLWPVYEVVIADQPIAPWERSAAAAWRSTARWIANGWDKRSR
jgi:hypothetical protein